MDFPVFPTAILGRFAPFNGYFAVIVDEIGLHFIDCATGKESRLIIKSGVTALSFSPRDSYIISCEKFSSGAKNLIIWDCRAGKEIAEFEWRKTAKEGPRSIKFTKDEKFSARLVSKS